MSTARPMRLPASAHSTERAGMPSREIQELWFATRRRDWKSLVVVPTAPGKSAFAVAQALGNVGGLVRMSPVQVMNAEGLNLDKIAIMVDDMSGNSSSSVWTSKNPGDNGPEGWGLPRPKSERAVIVAVEPVFLNPLMLPIPLAADAVLLCLELGRTLLADAAHTVEVIGRERIIGAVLLHD